VVTADASIEYDYLALATGMRLAHEEIPGLAERPEANLCPFERAAGLDRLRRRIETFTGGHVLVATPIDPYTCPPAPYEYALAWAAHITRRRLKARVTLIEPRSRPTPAAIAEGLMRAMEAYDGALAYEPFTQVRAIDPVAGVAETEVGRLQYDLLSVIPPHRAMPFIADAGLGAAFAEVDPSTFRSTRDERIYAVGDTADTPYAKTGYTAMDSARVAAAAIARELGLRVPAAPVPANMCYPIVAPDRALLIETQWALEQDQFGATHVKVTGRHDNRARASHARLRRRWEARALSTLFGTRGDSR
jgi:NADPH-dependent 2,4-dienoyl-CoA reductase/sulfur reductase-like enzyme